jgi:hypothetical protein
MKSLLSFVLATVILVSAITAAANCRGEAQIIAQTGSILKKTYQSCVLQILPASIVQYNMSGVCPLDLDTVLAEGVNVGIKDGHDCGLEPGSSISGILYIDALGQVSLER